MNLKRVSNIIRDSKEAKNTIWLFLLQGFDKLIPLVIVPYLMITVGAEAYGFIGFSYAVVGYLVLLINFGFGLSSTKKIAIAYNDRIKLSSIFISTLAAKILLLLIGTPVLFIIILLSPSLKPYSITCLCMTPMAIGAMLSTEWLYQGLGKIKTAAIINSVCQILILPLILIFVKDKSDYNIAAFIQSITTLVGSIILIVIIFINKWISFIPVKVKDIINELKDSFPLFLSQAATSTYTQLFTIILAIVADPVAVGSYSAAERIMRSVCFSIYSPISKAFYPRVAYLGNNNRPNAKQLLNMLAKTMFIVMLIISIGLFLLAHPISLFIGKDYVGLDRLIKIMAVTPLFISLGAIYGQMGLIALGDNKSKIYFRNSYLYAAPVSLLLVSILAWLFAETGASIAMLLTESFVFISMACYYKFKQC